MENPLSRRKAIRQFPQRKEGSHSRNTRYEQKAKRGDAQKSLRQHGEYGNQCQIDRDSDWEEEKHLFPERLLPRDEKRSKTDRHETKQEGD